MAQRAEPTQQPPPRAHGLHVLRAMLRIRRFEEKCAELYSAGKIRGFLHLYIGQEAVAVGAMQALEPEDAVVATYREHGHALVRGVSAASIMAEMYGKVEGCSRGRGGSMHLFDAATRSPFTTASSSLTSCPNTAAATLSTADSGGGMMACGLSQGGTVSQRARQGAQRRRRTTHEHSPLRIAPGRCRGLTSCRPFLAETLTANVSIPR